MMRTISMLHCRGSDSDFKCVAMEIGMLSNVYSEELKWRTSSFSKYV